MCSRIRRNGFDSGWRYILKAGDKLHIAASHQNMEQFFKKIALRKEKIKNAMICGGGRVAYYLASQLCNLG